MLFHSTEQLNAGAGVGRNPHMLLQRIDEQPYFGRYAAVPGIQGVDWNTVAVPPGEQADQMAGLQVRPRQEIRQPPYPGTAQHHCLEYRRLGYRSSRRDRTMRFGAVVRAEFPACFPCAASDEAMRMSRSGSVRWPTPT